MFEVWEAFESGIMAKIKLFIYGYGGPSLLHILFSSCGKQCYGGFGIIKYDE